jgi:rod shape-determining protein MreD
MFASLVQGPLLRLFSVGLIVLALQRTIFTDLRPAGVTLQVMLALAAAAGAAGGPQRGALAGFVLGLMYDLAVGTPLGSSSIAMGLGGYVAGYVTSITIDPQWWLAALFTGLGAAVGEAMVPVIRAFIGQEQVVEPRLGIVVAVVAAGAMVLSPLLVPVGRWCLRIKRPEWKAPKEA